MTLVVAEAASKYVVMVSDRLTTKFTQAGQFLGNHDPLANKTILYLSEDDGIVIGYTGQAYLQRVPTDEWIARELWGRPLQSGPDRKSLATTFGGRPLHANLVQTVSHLRKRLAAVKGGDGVTLLIAGWRYRRRRHIPILIKLRAASPLVSSPEVLLRPSGGGQPLRGWVGARPPSDTPVQTVPGIHRAFSTAQAFGDAIRSVALQDETVGPHVMSVAMAPYRVFCSFIPSQEHVATLETIDHKIETPVAFSPWIVGKGACIPPQLIGGGSVDFRIGHWRVTVDGPSAPPTPGAPLAFSYAQARRPPPR